MSADPKQTTAMETNTQIPPTLEGTPRNTVSSLRVVGGAVS